MRGCVRERLNRKQVEQHSLRVAAGTHGSSFNHNSIFEFDAFDRFVLNENLRYSTASLDLHAKLARAANQRLGQRETTSFDRLACNRLMHEQVHRRARRARRRKGAQDGVHRQGALDEVRFKILVKEVAHGHGRNAEELDHIVRAQESQS